MNFPLDELEFEFSLRPDSDPTLGLYVIDFRGKALIWDDNLGRERVVAEMRGHRLDLATASMDGLDQNLLLDSVCPEISELSETVFHDQGCHYCHPGSDGQIRRQEYDGLVYINEITVDPELRGHNIGSMLMSRIGQMIDVENCIIGLKAMPIHDGFDEESSDDEIKRVKQFYERMGFIHAGGEFMIKEASHCETMKKRLAWRLNHETGYVQPRAEALH
jgi:GNAT superfamily N-acetyltransferase